MKHVIRIKNPKIETLYKVLSGIKKGYGTKNMLKNMNLSYWYFYNIIYFLESKGIITRRVDENNRRRIINELTDKGELLLKALETFFI